MASSNYYTKLSDDNKTIHSFTTEELIRLGLAIPGSRLTLAFQALNWEDASTKINPNPVRLGGSILLFGPPNCGAENLISSVIKNDVKKFTLELKQQQLSPAYIKETFKKAKDSTRSVVIVNAFDEWLQKPGFQREILSEIHSVVSTRRENVFIVAHATQPWTIGDKIMSIFEHKIHVHGPNLDARAMLLGHYLEEVRIKKDLNTFNETTNVISHADLKIIAKMPALTNATWGDLKYCANEAFDNACKGQKKSIEINMDDLKEAVKKMKINNGHEEEIQKFKTKWRIQEYFVVEPIYFDYHPKPPMSFGERICWWVAECMGTWI